MMEDFNQTGVTRANTEQRFYRQVQFRNKFWPIEQGSGSPSNDVVRQYISLAPKLLQLLDNNRKEAALGQDTASLFFGIRDGHGILGSDFEALKVLHGN